MSGRERGRGPQAERLGAAAQNITPLTEAGAFFEKREVLYRDLLNALPAAIYTTDAQGVITFYNEAAVELAGRRPVIGVDHWCVTWKLYDADGAPLPHDACPMAVALKEGRELRGVEAVAERPDGSRLWFIPYPTLVRDEGGRIVGAVNMLIDITERKEAEAHQAMLAREVNHRANNLLGNVQAILGLTRAPDVESFRGKLEGRIGALAHAHSLLARARWRSADLQHLLTAVLTRHMGGPEPRVWISGPIVPLTPAEAQNIAVVIHELASNAAAHGALAGAHGRVMLEWSSPEPGVLSLKWRELDGPLIRPPRWSGLGIKLIRGAAAQLKGETAFEWPPEGAVCQITWVRPD
jgi:PAS domain S-box-containing protein